MRAIAALLESSVQLNFRDQSAPDGAPWADLSDATKRQRERIGKWPGPILRVTGRLADSIISDSDATSAVAGTNVVYAGVHQFGASRGEFGATTAGSPIPWGDIPARPFLGISSADELDIIDVLNDHFDDAFRA